MNQEIIIYNECRNAGDRIYTYYDDMVGAMMAFGNSAFLAAKMASGVLCMWNNELNMPCAILRKEQMMSLQRLGEVDNQESDESMLQLILREAVGMDKVAYDKWVQKLKDRNTKSASTMPVEEVMKGECSDDSSSESMKPVMGSHNMNMLTVGVIVIALIFVVLLAFVV